MYASNMCGFINQSFNLMLDQYSSITVTGQAYDTVHPKNHYKDVIMITVASQITSLTVVSIIYSGADQRKHRSSASLAFVRGIHRDRWIPRTKGQVTQNMFPFDDIIMNTLVSRCVVVYGD